jgi:hypothetical protein
LKPQRQKHNYTSELELKSLLIRIKNTRQDIGIQKDNTKINKYIKLHTKINNKKYDYPAKRNIELSEKTSVDKKTYERFGEVILLMIKNILKKPQFSGYTYRDDFYSDAIYKILKYLCNFNHKLISERTGQPVNSFAYISQIIHNSILFIINTKKKENDNLKKQISIENVSHNLTIKNQDHANCSTFENEEYIEETIILKSVKTTLADYITNSLEYDIEKADRINIIYPKDYRISFDEYDELKLLLKSKICIMREK